ncbi:CHAT domain-containing protein [Spirillospora sp. NPDC050679]
MGGVLVTGGGVRPRPERLRVLYLTASSAGDLRVDEEIRRVKAGVRATLHRDLVEIEHLSAATTDDLLDGLTRFRPHVVHFSGHANAGVLVFDTGRDRRGPGLQVPARAFAAALASVDSPPRLVVLNACKSQPQLAELIAGGIGLAVGMADSIGDPAAIAFATRFYTSLADGQSVRGAHATGKADLAMKNLPDADLPVLEHAPTIDPAQTVLVEPPRPSQPAPTMA